MRYLSVCSGIEAASVAWAPLGFSPVAFAEVEAFPCAVLAERWPDVPNMGDMTQIDGGKLRGAVDVLVGGTPCQSFSVAGLRRGLDDERGNLALEFARLADECNPAFIIWENVPGVLSDRGNAFGCLLAALASENAPLLPPGGRWTDSGYVLGPGRAIAWRILDAQYFGLAQRRRRVFLVACPCGGADPRKVLFEFGGLRRDTAPSREKAPEITQALTGGLGTGGPDDNRAQGGFYVPQIVEQAMSCKWCKGTSGPAGDEYHNLIAAPLNTRPYADNVAQESRLAVHVAQPPADGQAIAFTERTRAGGRTIEFHTDQAYCQQNPGGGRSHNLQILTPQLRVRRLTPLECERLQGFPDHYTRIAWRGKTAANCPDAPRYKALGNAMAVPVMRWIGKRILAADKLMSATVEA